MSGCPCVSETSGGQKVPRVAARPSTLTFPLSSQQPFVILVWIPCVMAGHTQ